MVKLNRVKNNAQRALVGVKSHSIPQVLEVFVVRDYHEWMLGLGLST